MPSRLSLLSCLYLFSRLWLCLGGQQAFFLGVAGTWDTQRSMLSTHSIILILILYNFQTGTLQSLFYQKHQFLSRKGKLPINSLSYHHPHNNHYIHTMKLIIIMAFVALAIAQFPDFSQIGEAIKNGVVEAEQKVEHFAKEQIQIAGEKINEGINTVSEAVNPSSPAPAPPAEETPKNPPAEVTPVTPTDAPAVFVPLLAVELPQGKATEATVQPVKPEEQKPIEKKQKKEWEHKGKEKHGGRPHHEREEASSNDIEIKKNEKHERRQKHEGKQRHERKDKHEYTAEELEKKREERERRIKAKEEHMKNYEKKHRNIEGSIDERKMENNHEKARQNYKEIEDKLPEDPKLIESEMLQRVKLFSSLQVQP